jgi:hypothetical protein
MTGDNHHVPPVELALLSSTPAKASAGPRCGDCGRTKTPQWMVGPMGPSTLCADCGLRHWHVMQQWDRRSLRIYQTTIPVSLSQAEVGVQWVECPRGRVGRTYQLGPSTPPMMSIAPPAWTVPKSSDARTFPSLLHRPAALPAARPLMSSAPTASTVPKSSGARLYPSPPVLGVQWVESPRGQASHTGSHGPPLLH